MKDYGEHIDTSTNRKTYARANSRDGKTMDLSETSFDSRVTSSLKYAVSSQPSQYFLNFYKSYWHDALLIVALPRCY